MKTRLLLIAACVSTTGLRAQEWHDTGNTGMNPTTNFVGNIDNVPFNFRTHNLRRMQLLETRMTNTINGFTNIEQNGYVGISRQPGLFNGVGPYSRLHLMDSTSNSVGVDMNAVGFRRWMKNGITMTGNGDQCYIGHKYRGADESDLVLQWSDDAEYDPYLTDRLRFIFTNDYNSGATSGATCLEGLETFRIFVPSNDEAYVGIGDWNAAATDPEERLDVLDGAVRIRDLPSNTFEDPSLTQIVMTDPTGVLHWRDVSSLPDNCEWNQISGGTFDDDVYTAYGTVSGCPDKDNSVGIGTITPAAKLDVVSNVVTDGTPRIGIQCDLKADGTNNLHSAMTATIAPNSGNAVLINGVTATASNADSVAKGVHAIARATNASITMYELYGVHGEALGNSSGGAVTNSYGIYGKSGGGASTVTNNYGVYGNSSGGGSSIGVQGSASGTTGATGVSAYAAGSSSVTLGVHGVSQGSAQNRAVYGRSNSSGTNNYGVYGWAQTGSVGNIGVYGQVDDTTATNWAGYFTGKVRGTATVYGINFSNTSDENLKTNVEDLEDASSIIAQLSPKTYEFIPGVHANLFPPSGPQIGLLAQDLEEVLPQLVDDVTDPAAYDEQGNELSPAMTFKSVNYIGLIPVLIGAMQEQQATIAEQNARLDAMEQDLAACCEGRAMMQGLGGGNTDGQNTNELRTSEAADQRLTITPNPFSEGTVIGYTLPKAGMVSLQVSDASGKSLFNLFEGQQMEGTQRYDWNTSFLAPGMYHVTLLVDGAPW
ncbi:MAG: tail fiber domain-containing protein [Flavobacteriales bacterium]|nr:tail fiber domain-containing protein [Flavobacteriales bacterium]